MRPSEPYAPPPRAECAESSSLAPGRKLPADEVVLMCSSTFAEEALIKGCSRGQCSLLERLGTVAQTRMLDCLLFMYDAQA